MAEYVNIRNKSNVVQKAVIDEVEFILQPAGEKDSEKLVLKRIGQAFMEQSLGYVEFVDDDLTGTKASFKLDTDVWLANMTGDPDASPTVPKREMVNRRETTIQVENPYALARPLKWKKPGGQHVFQNEHGEWTGHNLSPTPIELKPYTRMKYPKVVSDFILRRLGNQEAMKRGLALKSRAPTEFEPDISWELDDMRLYLRMMDPAAELGQSEYEVKQIHKHNKLAKEQAILAAKELCLRRCFFRLVNVKYNLPTREQFLARKGAFIDEVPEESAAAIVAEGQATIKKAAKGNAAKL